MAKGIPQGKTIFAQRIFFLCRCSIGLIDFKKQQRKNGILLSNYISTQKKFADTLYSKGDEKIC
jgi:hypothetical protein